MPTYEYRCDECGHQFEAFQSILAEALSECPVCNGTVQRLIGRGNGVIFKGSGFYITDYKKSPKRETQKEDKVSTEKS